MTPKEAADQLDGNEYTKEGSPELFQAMAKAGLVAVYGASDDLMEFAGAISAELGSYDGTTAYVTKDGLLENDCSLDTCPYFEKMKEKAVPIEAVWAADGYSWTYKTDIPYVPFTIKEDGDDYCEGIVFALADVPEK